ncbi:MAG TPA: SDR family oxidoreductase [Chitinophagaceae bacterium]
MRKINEENRNKYALITGATSGIGYELAKLFANDGYSLVLSARNAERLQEVANELKQLGVEVTPIAKDLFRDGAAKALYQEVKERGILIDVLVNDAGQGEHGKFIETSLERQLELIHLNVVSLVALTHLFTADMVKRGTGKVLQLGSVVSKIPSPYLAVYAASKAFVLSFSEALSYELKDTGVTMTCLMPGRTDTDFFHKAHMEETKEYQKPLSDPAMVARYGYEALKRGDTKVVAGVDNKIMLGMTTMMPDSMNIANMADNMQPTEKPEQERRQGPEHQASRIERKFSSDGTVKEGA